MSPLAQVRRRLARLSLDPLPGPSSLRQGEPIAGKRILVTGASSGVGRAAAVRLAAEEAKVLAVARREDELEALETEVAGTGGTSYSLPCDLTDADAIDALTEDVITRSAGWTSSSTTRVTRSAGPLPTRPSVPTTTTG
jgi:NAD(P)-dependent dehydrogenase (short-subunit alcohol dehydrogenase family)